MRMNSRLWALLRKSPASVWSIDLQDEQVAEVEVALHQLEYLQRIGQHIDQRPGQDGVRSNIQTFPQKKVIFSPHDQAIAD